MTSTSSSTAPAAAAPPSPPSRPCLHTAITGRPRTSDGYTTDRDRKTATGNADAQTANPTEEQSGGNSRCNSGIPEPCSDAEPASPKDVRVWSETDSLVSQSATAETRNNEGTTAGTRARCCRSNDYDEALRPPQRCLVRLHPTPPRKRLVPLFGRSVHMQAQPDAGRVLHVRTRRHGVIVTFDRTRERHRINLAQPMSDRRLRLTRCGRPTQITGPCRNTASHRIVVPSCTHHLKPALRDCEVCFR